MGKKNFFRASLADEVDDEQNKRNAEEVTAWGL
jgi:hypothetical protein